MLWESADPGIEAPAAVSHPSTELDRSGSDTCSMPDPSTPEVSASRARPSALGWVVLFIGAIPWVTYFLVRLVDAPESPDPDYLWRPWWFLDEHGTTIAVVASVVFVVAGAALRRARLDGRLPDPAPAQVAALALFAVWVGVGYRGVTFGVNGANIGGGMVVLVTPVLAVVTIAFVVAKSVRASRAARPER